MSSPSLDPEDIHGTWGYERFLEIMSSPDDEEYREVREGRWYGYFFGYPTGCVRMIF